MSRSPSPIPDGSSPSRQVFCAEALAWLAEHPARAGTSVVTSLPDVSEMSGMDLPTWQEWFTDAACRLVRWLPPDGVAIFYQSDIRYGAAWIDKGYLVQSGSARAAGVLLWHRIVCRRPPDTPSLGRASYSHMICVARELPRTPPRHAAPDVLSDAGHMSWSRAMGLAACRAACAFLKKETATRLVLDPFCGRGAVLAIANDCGFDAIGVDISAKRCRAARSAAASEGEP